MIRTELHIRRENNLIVFVAMNRHIGPIQHGLDHGSRIDDLYACLDAGATGENRNTDGPFETVTEFGLSDPNGFAAVGVLFHRPVYQHVAAGPVMIGNIPFNTAGEPSTEHSDEGRLDAGLGVEEIVTVCEVLGLENPSANLGKYSDADVIVLQLYDFVSLVNDLVCHHIVQRVGIDITFCSLVGPSSEEDRICLGCSYLVSRDYLVFDG